MFNLHTFLLLHDAADVMGRPVEMFEESSTVYTPVTVLWINQSVCCASLLYEMIHSFFIIRTYHILSY
jgi:hypothetical protein